MPIWNVLISDAGGNVEHDDAALPVDVVTVTQSTELFLSSCVPDIEYNLTKVLSRYQILSQWLPSRGNLTVVNPKGWTSTPNVAMYFFSNSPVK